MYKHYLTYSLHRNFTSELMVKWWTKRFLQSSLIGQGVRGKNNDI